MRAGRLKAVRRSLIAELGLRLTEPLIASPYLEEVPDSADGSRVAWQMRSGIRAYHCGLIAYRLVLLRLTKTYYVLWWLLYRGFS